MDTLVTWRLDAAEGLERFKNPDGGDGFTEWYRGLQWLELREHIMAVIRLVRGLWSGSEPTLGLS